MVIETVAYIYTENKKLLLVRTKGKKTYYMPGGKVDIGEKHKDALVRELKEELTIDIDHKSIKLYKVFEAQAHGKPQGTTVRIFCFTAKHSGSIKPGREIADYRFFSEEEYRLSEDPAPIGFIINTDLKQNELID